MPPHPPDRPAELPTGTVTFLFTDIEGSTRLIQRLGDEYPAVLARHRDLIQAATAARGGATFGSEGDALFIAFRDAASAIAAAAEAQRSLAGAAWPEAGRLRVRMGIHSGEAALVGQDYVGLTLHQAARIASAAHGGQVIVSDSARALATGSLGDGLGFQSLGEHRLKDLAHPERLFQLAGPGLEVSFPPPRTLRRPNNLPLQVTSFVGRDEVEKARTLLRGTRLLTLTGPGGTGKTRIALQLAAEVMDDYQDGAFFVALDSVDDAELVPSAIAQALKVEPGPEPPIDRIVAHLRDRTVLLVLDNFEQVVAASPAISRLLREVPGLAMVVTSRVLLRASGEQEFPVPPLALPEAGDGLTVETAARSEAVRLFVERAMAAQPAFRLSDATAPAIADIVRRLDGLPLAIELAAARVRVLPVDALRARLDQRLSVLTGGARDLPARQQTLRGAIDWSYDLLEVADRRLFERFAVFAGGACLDEAEAVCRPAAELDQEVLDGLGSLVEKSLVRSVPGSAGEPRFAMLATIREYALERLVASGELDELRRRHAGAYLSLAEELAPRLTGGEAARWLDRLVLDHDNLRAAIDWAIERNEAETAVRFGSAVWRFWQTRGHLHEARDRLARALAMPGLAGLPPALAAKAYGAAGSIAYWRNDQADANAHYARALELARDSGDKATLAEALYNFAFAPVAEAGTPAERWAGLRDRVRESLRLYEELGDARGIAGARWALGIGFATVQDWDAAREHLGESLRINREIGDSFGVAWANHMLGLVDLVAGRLDAAERSFREAMTTFQATSDVSGFVLVLLDFAGLARERGQRERAWRLTGASKRLAEVTGTGLVLENPLEIEGWEMPVQPTDADDLAAWNAGALLSVEEAVAEALRT